MTSAALPLVLVDERAQMLVGEERRRGVEHEDAAREALERRPRARATASPVPRGSSCTATSTPS